jgi:hypothetical protein
VGKYCRGNVVDLTDLKWIEIEDIGYEKGRKTLK